jgi:hypothetical protein
MWRGPTQLLNRRKQGGIVAVIAGTEETEQCYTPATFTVIRSS